MKVEKRDGTIQSFKFDKIEAVINKVFASKSVNEPVPDKLIEQIKEYFDSIIAKQDAKDSGYAMPIEDIQDVIRDFLIKKNKTKAVDAFIKYRQKREEIRAQKSWLTRELTRKLKGTNIENQNANVDELSFGGRKGEASNLVAKDYALKYCVSKRTRENHELNINYIHDLDNYAVGNHNCLSYPFDKILKRGFNTRQADVRPAGSVNTASQLVAVNFQLQSLQQFGGVSATHIDWTMVPYVRKSFEKHYISHYLYECDGFMDLDIDNMSESELDVWVSKHTADFFIETGLTDEDFRYDNFDVLDPIYVQRARMDNRKETYQAVEGLYHNLNTLQSRSGNQLPFTSINYGTCTLPEGRLFTRAIIEVSLRGTGKFGRTSIFPCGIFQWKKGVNAYPGDPNYDLKKLAIKSTSKRLYPNYANCNWSNQVSQINADRKIKKELIDALSIEQKNILIKRIKDNPKLSELLYIDIVNDELQVSMWERPTEMFSTMGCRTANGVDINFKEVYRKNLTSVIETGKVKYDDLLSAAQKDGRGNIAPTTIILPTLAMMVRKKLESKGDINEEELVEGFISLLTQKIEEAKDSLIERFKYICSQPAGSAKYMYENGTMAGYREEEGIISAIKHGTIVIGQIGDAETLQILIGCDHTTDKGMKLAKRIEQLYLDKCNEYKEHYSLNFGVYYTPAENLCFTSFKKWKEQFGDYEGVTYFIDENGERHDKEYFTNSMHVPVWHKMSPFKKIDIESQLTGYSNAGCITYVEMDHEVIHNLEYVEKVIDYAMEHDIPYFAINVPSDTCLDCGYQGHIGEQCPYCGSTRIERLARVTGYLTGSYPDAFNPGKVSEKEDRVIHKDVINL